MVKFTGKNVVRFIITSVILVISALFVFNFSAKAAEIDYVKISEMTPEQQIVSYSYYRALNDQDDNSCKYSSNLGTAVDLNLLLTEETKKNKRYVGDIAEKYAGTIDIDVSGNDGVMQCQSVLKAAIKLWTGKHINELNEADKISLLSKLGYIDNSNAEYYCYATFPGQPMAKETLGWVDGFYEWSSTNVQPASHPFLSFTPKKHIDDKGYTVYGLTAEDIENAELNTGLSWWNEFDDKFNEADINKDGIITDYKSTGTSNEYSTFCNTAYISRFVEVVGGFFYGTDDGKGNGAYAAKTNNTTHDWIKNINVSFKDFVINSIYDGESPSLGAGLGYYLHYWYFTRKDDCEAINLGNVEEFKKSIEGNSSIKLSDDSLWIDTNGVQQGYKYAEVTTFTDNKGTTSLNGYKMNNISKTGMSGYGTSVIMPIDIYEYSRDYTPTCQEIAIKLNEYAALMVQEIIDSRGVNPYGDLLGILSTNSLNSEDNTHVFEEDDNNNTTTCAVDGIGWLICPATKAMSKLVDAAYFLVTEMLTTPALNTDTSGSETDNSMYAMWKIMRTFANIAFVIAFLIITFSQMTSVGISNYGIKKMLPKLIIAAILVNISYFMCAIAIDISNITGFGINSLLEGINKSAAITTEKPTAQILAGAGSFIIGGFTASVAVAATGGAWAALTLLLPGLIAAVIAIMTVFLVLTLRQALIILLVVVSPLALVAYILPNTESWYKKWKDLFITMLMMFPIISAVFGISKLASTIVVSGANGHGMIALMGMFIQFIPLAITPLVLKSAGGVLNKFAGMVNNPNRGPFDAMKKGAGNIRKRAGNRANAEAMNLNENSTKKQWLKNGNGIRRSVLRYNARRDFLDKSMQSDVNRTTMEDTVSAASADGTNGKSSSRLNARMQKQMSPNAYSRSMANAKSALLKMRKEEIEERMQNMASNISSPGAELDELEAQLQSAIKAGDEVSARAAQGLLLKTAPGRDKVHKTYKDQSIVTAFGQKTSLLNNLKNDINSAGIKASDASLAKFAYDNGGTNGEARNLSDIEVDASTYEGLSMHEMSSQTKGNIGHMINNGVITPEIAYKITDVKNGYGVAADKLPMFNEVAKNYVPPVQNNP